MGAVVNAVAVLIAALSVGAYVVAGEMAVLLVVMAGVGGLAWRVAVTSRPRPLRMVRRGRRAPRSAPDGRWAGPSGARKRLSGARDGWSGARKGRSGVRIGHERDAHVVDDEGGQRQ